MKKRAWQLTLLVLVLLCAIALLCACDDATTDEGKGKDSDHVHEYSERIVETEPTCATNGVEYVVCSCGDKMPREIPALAHTEVVDEAVAPSCAMEGKTEGKHCSVCNVVLVAQEPITKMAHTEVIDAAVAPTCAATGLTEGMHCSVCNSVIVAQQTIAATGHTEVIDAAVVPTCSATGLTEGKHCSVCNTVLVAQETVAASEHTEVVDAAVAPTCTVAGKTAGKHCSVCNTVLVAQETVGATGHTEVVDAAVAATCTTAGKTAGKHCSVCNTVLVAQEVVAATGHNYTSVVTNPTATQDGFAVYTCSTCAHSYEEVITPTNFTITAENRAMIGYTGENGQALVIPTIFENEGVWYRVTAIGNYAFNWRTSLVSVTIPDSVTSIGRYAFDLCTGLTSVTFGKGVTRVDEGAFASCSALANVYVSDVVAWLGISFENSSAHPNRYGKLRFLDAQGNEVTSLVIPDSVTSIGEEAFYNGAFTSVTIGKGVQSVGKYAFYNCKALTEIKFNATAMNDLAANNYVFGHAGKDGTGITVTFGENVTKIPACLFYPNDTYQDHSTNVTSVIVGNAAKSIGEYAFYKCSTLTHVTMGNGVTNIGAFAFDNYSSIEYTVFEGCFYLGNDTNPYLALIKLDNVYASEVTIHPNTKTIAAYAFSYSSIERITIPQNVVSIGDRAFDSCTSLERVMISGSVTSIGVKAFVACSNLASVTFDNASGWWVAEQADATAGTSVDVSNPTTAASCLKTTYKTYYWKRG